MPGDTDNRFVVLRWAVIIRIRPVTPEHHHFTAPLGASGGGAISRGRNKFCELTVADFGFTRGKSIADGALMHRRFRAGFAEDELPAFRTHGERTGRDDHHLRAGFAVLEGLTRSNLGISSLGGKTKRQEHCRNGAYAPYRRHRCGPDSLKHDNPQELCVLSTPTHLGTKPLGPQGSSSNCELIHPVV